VKSFFLGAGEPLPLGNKKKVGCKSNKDFFGEDKMESYLKVKNIVEIANFRP
jgi:hypothetical protein